MDMDTDMSKKFEQQIEKVQSQYPSILEDFKKYYVLHNSDPKNSEYKNYYNNANYQLTETLNNLTDITKQIVDSTNRVNLHFQKIDGKITEEREINAFLKDIYGNVEGKLGVTTQLIDNYKELYKREYRKTILLGIGIIAVSYGLHKL
jgi:predicted DNA-binding ArsR family transcriptional regulator